MLARTPSTFRLIGAGVTSVGALAAIFGAGGSNAQTLANLDTDRTTFIEGQCGHIRDATEGGACRLTKFIEFNEARAAVAKQRIDNAKKLTAEADQAITTEQLLQRCGQFLRGKRDREGVVFDRKITRENMCSYARELGMRDGPG